MRHPRSIRRFSLVVALIAAVAASWAPATAEEQRDPGAPTVAQFRGNAQRTGVTDAAVRALKRNWGRLHALVHPIAILGLWHFFLQSRFDVFEPILLAGLYAALIALRLFARLGRGDGPLAIVAAALAAALVTLGVEIAWYGLNNGIAATRVLRADFSLASGLRPLWWVVIGALSPLVVSRWLRSIGLPLFSGVKSG